MVKTFGVLEASFLLLNRVGTVLTNLDGSSRGERPIGVLLVRNDIHLDDRMDCWSIMESVGCGHP